MDCMGGDLGVEVVIRGMAKAFSKNNSLNFIVHGNEEKINKILKKFPKLNDACTVKGSERTVEMHEKPSSALRNGKNTSMWNALSSVKKGYAQTAVSCGNTGALMAMAMILLKKAPSINRPAIAVLWPSLNKRGFSVVLDAGADIRADSSDLLQYALMGSSYAKIGFNVKNPRLGLLNIGTEPHKGHTELHVASNLIEKASKDGEFNYIGYVEGCDLHSSKADVIVTDGFTGNVALKTGEGTASLINGFIKQAFSNSIWSRIGAIFALSSLRRLKKRIDPRRVNGGVFLGLNGTVIKSHGSADATGVAAAIKLAFELSKGKFSKKLVSKVGLYSNNIKETFKEKSDL